MLYPQPFGFQAEWNWGRGPELNASPDSCSWKVRSKADMFKPCISGTILCLTYAGKNTTVRKKEPDQFTIQYRSMKRKLGVEYQINRALELTVAYSWMKRTDTANCALPHP